MVSPVEKNVNSHVGRLTVTKVMSHRRAPGTALITRHRKLEELSPAIGEDSAAAVGLVEALKAAEGRCTTEAIAR